MRGDIIRLDLHAHRERLWGKDFTINCDRKTQRNAKKKPFDNFHAMLWLSGNQGTYNFKKHGPLK